MTSEMTELSALDAARNISDYWLKQGYQVHCRVEKVVGSYDGKPGPLWVVRSDLVNGLPVGYRAGKRGSVALA